MLEELKQTIVKVDCMACNGSLNSYDSYSCPVCQGAGFAHVKALEGMLLPECFQKAGNYEAFMERL
jgi:hypothetical protein